MKERFFPILGLVFLGFIHCGCPPRLNSQFIRDKKSYVYDLQNKTVSLVKKTEGESNTFCTGVWVGKREIITAAHCVEQKFIVNYQTVDDLDSVDNKAVVVKVDVSNDLALLHAPEESRSHPIAEPTSNVWSGQPVGIVGHPVGYRWTYIDGTVSAQRILETEMEGNNRLMVQISSAAWMGNSGGAAFDENGNMVGICSWVSTRGPMLSFFTHASLIKKFLSR